MTPRLERFTLVCSHVVPLVVPDAGSRPAMTVGTGWLYGIVKRSSIRECPVISGNSPDTLGCFWASNQQSFGEIYSGLGLGGGVAYI